MKRLNIRTHYAVNTGTYYTLHVEEESGCIGFGKHTHKNTSWSNQLLKSKHLVSDRLAAWHEKKMHLSKKDDAA